MPDTLQLKLAAARRKWRMIAAASILLLATAALVSLVLVSFYSDRMLVLESSGRYYWQVALFATLVLSAIAIIALPLRRRIPDEMVAAAVEKRYPALGERLLSTIELAHSGGGFGASSQMIAALQRETESATSDLSFSRAIPYSTVRRPAAFASFAVGVLGIHFLLAPEALGVWFKRIMNPAADIPLFARTLVWAAPERKVVPRGEDIDITVKLAGRLLEESSLFYKFGDGSWARANLKKPEVVGTAEGEFRKFRFQIPDAQQDLSFYATAGDGRSNPHTVRVEDRPAVLSVRMELDYPDYTGKPNETITTSAGNIVAPVGTRVNLTATANKPLGSAQAVSSEKRAIAWRVDGARAAGQIAVKKDEKYTLKLRDQNGFDAEQDPQYTVRAQPDRTPEVQISRPGADIDRSPDATVNLMVTASDDYGVTSTAIVYSIGKRNGNLPLPGAKGSTQVTASAGWNLGSLGLKAGDTVVYHAAARDGDNVSGPHTGKSSEYRIHILSHAEMRERLEAQQAQEREALKQLLARQKEAQKALEEARKSPANGEKLAHAQGAQRSVAQETAELARRMEQTGEQMRDNNLGTPQQMQQRDAARQSLQQMAQKAMPQAADAIQRAQNQPSSRNRDLSDAARQEQQIKEELERMIREQEPGNDLSQLADEAERLAQEQRKLADESSLAAAQTENKAPSEMSAQERSALNELAKKQAKLNAETNALEQQVQRAAKEARQSGRQNAPDISKAAQQMKQSGLQKQQDGAQKNLQSGTPRDASQQQSEAAKNLQDLAKQLDEAVMKSDNQDLEKRADKLEAAADELNRLSQQQLQVLNETLANPGQAKSQELAQRERGISEKAQKIGEQLKDAAAAQQSIERAQRSLENAAQNLSQSAPQQAIPPERQARMDLSRAAMEALEAARNMREQQAAREMQEQVQKLAREQRQLMQQTQQADKDRKNGAPSPGDQQSAALAQKQQELARQSNELTRDMPSTAFRWAMGQANRKMENAQRGLQQGNTGEGTRQQQQNAAQTLERIARSLGQQAQGKQQQQQSGGQQSGSQSQMADAAGELQLAREMEAQIREETSGIEQQRNRNPGRQPTADQQRELNNLAQAQRETRRIAENAAQRFRGEPDILRNIQRASEQMDAVQDRLQQQDSGRETQSMQQQIVQGLDRAIRQSQQSMRQQRQQMAQSQQQQSGQNGQQQQQQPGGSSPAQRSAPPLSNVQYGRLNEGASQKGRGFGNLSPRAMQSLREGRQEKVPAEYRDLVNQYYKALSERSGR